MPCLIRWRTPGQKGEVMGNLVISPWQLVVDKHLLDGAGPQGPGWGWGWGPRGPSLRLLSTVETVETLVFACEKMFFLVLFRKFNGLLNRSNEWLNMWLWDCLRGLQD